MKAEPSAWMGKIATALLAVGLAATAAYLNVHGQSAPWLWLGVFMLTVNLL